MSKLLTSALLTQTLFRVLWEGGVVTCLVFCTSCPFLWLSKAKVREKLFLLSWVASSSFQNHLKEKNDLWENSVLILRYRSTLSIQTLSCHQWSCPPRCPTSDPCLLAHCWPSSRAKAAGKAQLCLIAIHVQSVVMKQSHHLTKSNTCIRAQVLWQYALAGEY